MRRRYNIHSKVPGSGIQRRTRYSTNVTQRISRAPCEKKEVDRNGMAVRSRAAIRLPSSNTPCEARHHTHSSMLNKAPPSTKHEAPPLNHTEFSHIHTQHSRHKAIQQAYKGNASTQHNHCICIRRRRVIQAGTSSSLLQGRHPPPRQKVNSSEWLLQAPPW